MVNIVDFASRKKEGNKKECYNKNGIRKFFVKAYNAELEDELVWLMEYFEKNPNKNIQMSYENGCYRITSTAIVPESVTITADDMWSILFRKYRSLSYPDKKEGYYPVIMSDMIIPENTSCKIVG